MDPGLEKQAVPDMNKQRTALNPKGSLHSGIRSNNLIYGNETQQLRYRVAIILQDAENSKAAKCNRLG